MQNKVLIIFTDLLLYTFSLYRCYFEGRILEGVTGAVAFLIMRIEGHVKRVGEKRILMGISVGKRPLGRPRLDEKIGSH